MSYRKITVDEQTIEYSIGKTHTKIRHLGVWPNEQIGHYRSNQNGEYFLQVTPGDIINFVKKA